MARLISSCGRVLGQIKVESGCYVFSFVVNCKARAQCAHVSVISQAMLFAASIFSASCLLLHCIGLQMHLITFFSFFLLLLCLFVASVAKWKLKKWQMSSWRWGSKATGGQGPVLPKIVVLERSELYQRWGNNANGGAALVLFARENYAERSLANVAPKPAQGCSTWTMMIRRKRQMPQL